MFKIDKIISGGQTGADRAALDFAIANGIPLRAERLKMAPLT